MSTGLNTAASTFDEFHARHRDSEGKRLAWMADFYRAKEGVIMHRKANLKWRVLELAKKTSWGNKNRDYPADENGHPLTQNDLAKLLGVPFQRVSEAVEELVEEGFLRREGRILIVVDDPAAARAERRTNGKRNSHPFVNSGEERAKFFAFWKERNPEQFQQYQKLGAEIEEKFRAQRELKDAAWAAYEEAQKDSGTGRKNAEEAPERSGENVRNGAEKTSGTERKEDARILNGLPVTSYKLASLYKGEPEQLVEAAVEASGLENLPGNRGRAIQNAAARMAAVSPPQRDTVLAYFEADCRQIAERRENKPKKWGIVVTAMEDAISAVKRAAAAKSRQRAAEPSEIQISIEEQIEALETTLRDLPDHPQAEEWKQELADLRASLSSNAQKAE